ncbi:MAG: aminopeptidase P family N-terminal domain-containing protein, partial [Rhizobiaceae bacterium]|nr:aminopeptidase P family N-terminal domain-containing protein [Hyphomicrobiales bacterium]NRB32505.1 aminopeptidase P family N-terminal domain-containing protein [Rhizobiaceae bacterium]
MFQNFDAPHAPVTGDGRLRDLRAWMKENAVSMVLVPHNDEQNNEYLPADKERLAWLTGFTGSAGSALVTEAQAVLFVDGRYTLQAAQQADTDHWTIESLIEMPPQKWVEINATSDDTLGFDPWLHSALQVKALTAASQKSGCGLSELASNPIDAIWQDQPPTPLEPTRIHDFTYAGQLTS